MLGVSSRIKRKGEMVTAVGGSKIRDLSLANPFLLPDVSGVRYYANEDLTGGHLSSMLTNAQKTSDYITGYLVKRNKKYLPAINEIMALEDRHHTTLVSRREFLESFIAPYCDDLYGSKNESLLPRFTPVKLKPIKALAKGEKYKKAPTHVALGTIKKLEGESAIHQLLLDPVFEKKTDEELRELWERIWFYFGDHERKIQGLSLIYI